MAKQNVLIDIRALLKPQVSGVKIYTQNLVSALLEDDSHNYALYCNSFGKQDLGELNAKTIYKHLPNKLLNVGLRLFSWPLIDRHSNFKTDIYLAPDLRPSALSPGVKKIQVVHDFSWHKYQNFFSLKTRLWFKLLNPIKEIKNANTLVCVSNAIKSECAEMGFKQNIQVIEPFIKTSKAAQQHTSERYFFYVGTLEPRKNLNLLLDAFASFSQAEANIKLKIAGDFDPSIFNDLKLKKVENVEFLGTITEEEKNGYLAGAIALVYLSEYEGFGLPVAESILSGTPCLISNQAALMETAGSAALHCNPHNQAEVVEKMQELLYNQTKYAQLKANCLKEGQKWQDKLTLQKWLNLFSGL